MKEKTPRTFLTAARSMRNDPLTEDMQQELEVIEPKDPLKNPVEEKGDTTEEQTEIVSMSRSDLHLMFSEAIQAMDKRWEVKFQQLKTELSGNGQEHEPADPNPSR